MNDDKIEQEEKAVEHQIPSPASPSSLVKTGIFNKTFSEIKLSADAIESNLKNLYCDKRIHNGQDEVIYSLAKSGNIVVSNSHTNIYAWDAATGETIWKFDGEYKLKEQIFINQDKVIVAGSDYNDKSVMYDKPFIMLLDLKTGQQIEKVHIDIDPELVTVSGQKIFAKLRNVPTIQSWDANSLVPLETYKTFTKDGLINRLVVDDNFIVHSNAFDGDVTVLDIKQNTGTSLTIKDISPAIIHNNTLILGTSGIDTLRPDVIVLDLNHIDKIGNMDTLAYRVKIHEPYPRDGSVQSISAYGDFIFIANGLSEVYAIDMKNKTHQLLENMGDYASTKFYIEDQLLFIISDTNRDHHSQVAIWDLNKMERIQTLNLTAVHDVIWDKGNLLVALERSWIRYNFNVSHKEKERLMEGSPSEPDEAIRGCSIS